MPAGVAVKPLIGLLGVLLATLAGEFNDQVVSGVLPDMRGALGISHDPGTWLQSLYVAGELLGMILAPWWMVTLSVRRFILGILLANCSSSILIAHCSSLPALYLLRWLQGAVEGLTIPLLMSTALRALPPNIRLWGLAVYASSATFTPHLAETLAAWWTDGLDWRFAFYESVPLCSAAALLCWYGLWRDPLQLQRIRQFDWPGALLGGVGFSALVTVLMQGDRLDWYHSPLISILTLLALPALPAFIYNELRQPLPLIRFFLLRRRNFSYGVVALFTLLIIDQAASTLPIRFLTQVQGYRPLQAHLVTLEIAAMQLLLLPLLAWLHDFEPIDPRVTSFIGFCCLLGGCLGCSFLTSAWNREQFYLWQACYGLGLPLVVMPILQMSTNSVVPQEGPFASVLVNAPRALSGAVGSWLLDLIQRWRGHLHSSRLTDRLGQRRFQAVQAPSLLPQHPTPLLSNGQPRFPNSLGWLNQRLHAEIITLTISDAYLVFAAITLGIILVLLILPVRTYPPRIALVKP